MKKNNKGFSYIELILVLAIMAIMVGLITLSIGTVSRANVNRGAEKLESFLNRARSNTMARGTERGMLSISCEDGAYYCYVGSPAAINKETELLVSSGVQIGYYINNGTSMEMLEDGETLYVKYVPSTGAFMPLSGSDYCTSIVLMNGDKVRTIVLHTATGKCTLQ